MFKVLFTYLPYAFALLLIPLFVLPSRIRTRAQAIWCMALLFCASKFVCFAAFGGDAFAPEMPEKVIWFWNWAYSGMCLLIPLSAMWLLVTLGKRPRLGLYLLPLMAWSMAFKGIYNGVRVPDVEEVEIVSENVPEELDGYRILQLSDLHASAAARRGRTEAVVAKANAVGADLIVVTGDLVDGDPGRQARNLEPIRELAAKDGVFHCSGNHEYYFDRPAWQRIYDSWGVRFLSNEWVSPHAGLVVAGVPDGACERFGEPDPDVNRAFADCPEGTFRVLIQHRPYVNWNEYGLTKSVRYDLQLSGHTHGGIAPLLNRLVKSYNGGLLRGLTEADGCRVYISRGTGQWAGFPIRFLDDPEITLLTLKRKKF